jgi:uncharacterized membrane protein
MNDDKLFGALAYLWFPGAIIAYVVRDTSFVRTHAIQSLVYFFILLVIQFTYWPLVSLLSPLTLGAINGIAGVFYQAGSLVALFLAVFMAFKALMGERYYLPPLRGIVRNFE